MAQVLQLRRGTTAQNDTFTGAAGEVTVDTDRKSLRVHDGSTMGGKEIADLATAIPLLTDATTVGPSDEFVIRQSGVVKRATASEFLNGTGTVTATGSTTGRTLRDRFADVVNVKDFGAVGDGVADDTAAIQAALSSTASEVIFPTGTYRVQSASETSSTPALTSSVDDRIIRGAGIITATTRVRKLLEVTGDRSRVSINIDGNQKIGHAIDIVAEDCAVTDCHIYDLDGLTDWQGMAIRVNLDGLDTSALIANNTISNLQGTGDGIGGNGVGMQRAVLVQCDQNCTKQILVTGNVIDTVEGEEGDSIVVAGGTSASPLDLPVIISNNTINLWSRRAVKIQARKVSVLNNTFQNNRSSDIGTLQRVVDVTSGSDIVVQGNTFQSCKYQAQVAVFLNSPQVGNNIVVSGNSVYGLGAETTSDIFVFRTYGDSVNITNNTIVCPNYAAVAAITVSQASQVAIVSNTCILGTSSWYDLDNASITNLRLAGNLINGTSTLLTSFYDASTAGAGECVVNISGGGGARSLTLYSRDSAVTDGERIASLSCRQNDDAYPDGLHASLQFVGEGSSGSTAVTLNSGSGLSPNVERLRVKANGRVGIGVDPSSQFHVDGDITVSNATTATTATAGAQTLPANPVGFLVVSINGTSRKIPYYAT